MHPDRNVRDTDKHSNVAIRVARSLEGSKDGLGIFDSLGCINRQECIDCRGRGDCKDGEDGKDCRD